MKLNDVVIVLAAMAIVSAIAGVYPLAIILLAAGAWGLYVWLQRKEGF